MYVQYLISLQHRSYFSDSINDLQLLFNVAYANVLAMGSGLH